MGLSQVNLQNYDMVVAVTQNAINETLSTYLDSLKKEVALYYTVDKKGNFVPVSDPAQAYYIFTGTLAYTSDAQNNPVDLVVLNSNGKGLQTVYYNITFSAAEFKSTIPPFIDVQQQTQDPPWIIKFLVNLGAQKVELASLPPATQEAVQQSVGSLGPDMFSVQQLYLDLNTAVYDTYQNIDGMTEYAETILDGMMRSYLAQLQASGGVIFGYALMASPGNATNPTFMPTALDFCVSPYTDATGNHSNPGLDTLNYLLMINNNPLPPAPEGFDFNWVEDNTKQGVMALRHDHYVQFAANQLSPILQPMCPVCYVKADVNKGNNDQTLQLNAGSPNFFTVTNAAGNGVVARCSYTSPQARDSDSSFGGEVNVTLAYSMSCTMSFSGNTITLAGYPCVSAETDVSSMTGDEALIMPATTFAWSVDLVLQMSLATDGQLTYSIQNENYDSSPTVAQSDESAWQKFLNAVGGVFRQFSEDPGDIRATVQSNVRDAIQPALQQAISTTNDYVFPGGNTFVFADPQLSQSNDLVAHITYLSPSAPTRGQTKTELPAAAAF